MIKTSRTLWGIDLGGTKTEGIVLKISDKTEVIARLRVPTHREKGYFHILNTINDLINQLKEQSGLKPHAVGIGTPGTLDPATGLLKNSNTTCLNGMPFKSDLEKMINIPVEIANDANCFSLAEATLGCVRELHMPTPVVFGLILGTGVGGGLVVNNKVINGKNGISGEWGHNFLDESGGKCYCGKTGCVETLISGTVLEKFYEQKSGKHITLKEIVRKYRNDSDPIAQETINRLIHFFGKAIAVVIDIVDPDVIVVGGGVGNIDELYSKGVEEAKRHIFNDKLETHFLKPTLGDSAGVFGAAMLTAN